METAGDCYIVAGALMRLDEDGFQALEEGADAGEGAEKVMAFSKVWIVGKRLANGNEVLPVHKV